MGTRGAANERNRFIVAFTASTMLPQCLRCHETALIRTPDSQAGIEFFECPACHRRYSKQDGQDLAYRWPNPIGIALYGFLFRSGSDADHVAMAVHALTDHAPAEQRARSLHEIELELQSPTQQLCSMLPGARETEAECRAFLRLVATELGRQLRPDA